MANHKQHDLSELADALEHVLYEMWKYKQSIVYYDKIRCVGGDAAIEFRVLHHRVLLEFFYGPAKHPNNILAWEYIDDWSQTHDRAQAPWLDNYMTRCHTMLAHISTSRTEMAKRGLKAWAGEWRIVEPHIDQTISDFLGRLTTGHKEICLQWATQWLGGRYLGNELLTDLVTLMTPAKPPQR